MNHLEKCGIQAKLTNGRDAPLEAQLHDEGADVPALVISPRSEWGVATTLTLLHGLELYGCPGLSISVKSGGHGYFNGASCTGIMLDLSLMDKSSVEENTLTLEPGCVLGQTMHTLAEHRKAVPHGDCFGVGAGGHFTTAGWDLILSRRYGLGCQSLIGGRIVLWDGSVLDVNDDNHPDLLHAMRGGAAAGVGVVVRLHLQLINEPKLATWRCTPLSRDQFDICVEHGAFSKALALPRDISLSFRFHIGPAEDETVCSLNIASLLPVEETITHLRQHMGNAVTSLLSDSFGWSEKSLTDLRMLPASEFLAQNPKMLAEVSSARLIEKPATYWNESYLGEMRRSYLASASHWVKPSCEHMLRGLYDALQATHDRPACGHIYAIAIVGGGRITELQEKCSMPLGNTLIRVEAHGQTLEDRIWCQVITQKISNIIKTAEDRAPGRPYRGDIWLPEQASDRKLDGIHTSYDRRFRLEGC